MSDKIYQNYASDLAAAASQSDKERMYWQKQLSGKLEKTTFPFDNETPIIRPATQDKEVKKGEVELHFSTELDEKLLWICNNSDIRLLMIFTASLVTLLNKYTGNEDIILGMPIYKQNVEGHFINTILPLRNRIEQKMTFKELLYQVKQTIEEAIKNQNFPMEMLLSDLNLKSSDGFFPLFDTYLLLENIQEKAYIQHIQTRIGFVFKRENQNIKGKVEYNTQFYTRETIETIISHLLLLIKGAINDVNILLTHINQLTEEEKKQILNDFNGTTQPSIENETLVNQFENQVKQTPNNIALIDFKNDSKTTYKELNASVNRLVTIQKKYNPTAKTIVAVASENPLVTIIAILAVLKAGGCYLPVDHDYPEDRKRFMLTDSNTTMVIGENLEPMVVDIPNIKNIIDVNRIHDEIDKQSDEGSNIYIPSTSPAYIIYTSGTTGKPKGVMVEHKQIVNTLNYRKRMYDMKPEYVSLQLFSYSFDGFVTSFFTPLISGVPSVLLNKDQIKDPFKIKDAIKRYNVSHFISVPSLYRSIINSLGKEDANSLKTVTLAGEAFTLNLLEESMQKLPHVEIAQEYGITEAAVMSTLNRHQETQKKIHIGTPIANAQIYILNRENQLQPIGFPGELCIAGAGVARGYLNKPELTAERFMFFGNKKKQIFKNRKNSATIIEEDWIDSIIKPLKTVSNHQRLYKTGDIAKWDKTGNIEFLGRADNQVKIRGFRIETGEIENLLLSHNAVKEAHVSVVVNPNGDKQLAAYIVPKLIEVEDTQMYSEQGDRVNSNNQTSNVLQKEIREFLTLRLPDYMIPQVITLIEIMPLTPNGKVDTAQLPSPDFTQKNKAIVQPRNDLETRIVQLWAEILGIAGDKIGIESNFFELGGHSLTATILVSRIHKEFQVKIQMIDFFKSATIKTISNNIQSGTQESYITIHPVEEREYYPISTTQSRFYVLQSIAINTTAYNINEIHQIEGELNIQQMQFIFKQLIKRHETLRTSFQLVNGKPVQRIHKEVKFSLETFDLTDPEEINNNSISNHENKADGYISNFIRPFDLSTAPLMRVGIIKTSDTQNILAVDMHHIASDGISHGILIQDFLSLLRERQLPPLRLQYKDFSKWLLTEELKQVFNQQKDYWLKQFEEEPPILNLPGDFPRPTVRTLEGNTITFSLESEQTRALNEIAQEEKGTLFMVLLTIYNIFIFKISNQEDIVVGTPIAGRRHADLEKIIGVFINTLPLRNFPSTEKTFRQLLHEVKEHALEAYKNQDYPFEDLVEQIVKKRDTSHNPIFDAMFVMQNIFSNNGEATNENKGELNIKPYSFQHHSSVFDLNLIALEIEHSLTILLQYSTSLFKDETINRFIQYIKKIIATVITDPNTIISKLEMISHEEKQQLLFDFNKTKIECPKDKTIDKLFLEQAHKYPDNVAIVSPSTKSLLNIKDNSLKSKGNTSEAIITITYNELANHTEKLADLLIQIGVKPGAILPIIANRSIQMITGLIGIMKTGAAYLPIDPEYPEERINYLLKDSNANYLITALRTHNHEKGEPLQSDCSQSNNLLKIINLKNTDTVTEHPITLSNNQNSTLKEISKPDSIAYIIYTSGSTGKPKGVPIRHQSFINLIYFHRELFREGLNSRMSQVANPGFDAMAFEVWPCLTSGATLIITKNEDRLQPGRMKQWIIENQINISFQPTIMAEALLGETWPEECISLKTLRTAGDRLTRYPNGKYPFEFYNLYGPTEDTVWTTYAKIEPVPDHQGIPPIGKPVGNHCVYIMNPGKELQPVGVVGELCISGHGLAIGYLNNPELSAEKFVRTSTINPLNTQTIYRTGDLARWKSNGNLEFIQRMDHQVKIRGFRIELGEIENQLIQHPMIKEAVVLIKNKQNSARHGSEKYLCAYIVPQFNENNETTPPNISQLREYLSKKLPEYMIPSEFVLLDKIPLTPNGKINRSAIESLGKKMESGVEYAAPRTDLEITLVKMWQEVLEVDQIGIHDNFFEKGGNSINAIRLYNKIKQDLKKDIPVVAMFEHVTIESFLEYLNLNNKVIEENQETIQAEDITKIKNRRADRKARRREEL